MKTRSLQFIIAKINANIDQIGEELNRLDAQLGDGDLGVTVVNGFKNMASVSADLPDDLGVAFMQCAQAMTKVSGSSFGTLSAIALMAVSKELKGKTHASWSDVSNLIGVAIEAMSFRGKSKLGDKTVLDSLEAIRLSIANEDNSQNILQTSLSAADSALVEFRQKRCMIGRARIFGHKTIGLDDPGMVAIARLLSNI